MSTKVKQEAAAIDKIIEANAAQARGETVGADSEAAPDPRLNLVESQPVAEDDSFEGGEQETDIIDETNAAPVEAEQALARAEQAEQRWKSLDGQLRSRDAQITQLTELVAKMAEGQNSAPKVEAEPASGLVSGDSDSFGDDMIDFVERVARSIVKAEISQLAGALDGLQNDVNLVSQNTAVAVNESFEGKLDKLAPRWREFDTAETFHTWLAESDTRKNLFLQGCQQKDAKAVAEIFQMYIGGVELAEARSGAASKSKVDKLEKQVAPGKSKSSAPASVKTPTGDRIWTRTEIATAYTNASKLDKDDWVEMERQIAAAQASGRVDYTK